MNIKKSLIVTSFCTVLAVLAMIPVLFRMPNPLQRPILYELHDASHTALFFMIAACLFLLIYFLTHKKSYPPNTQTIVFGVAALSLTIGASIEIVQFYIGREASLADMGRNGLGILAASCIYIASQSSSRRIKSACLVIAGLAVFIALAPTLAWLQAQHSRDQAFPVLMDFESPKANAYLKATDSATITITSAPTAWSSNSSMVAKVKMPADKNWSGFMLRSPQPNWSTFKKLNFDVFSTLPSALRISLILYTTQNNYRPTVHRTYMILPGINHLSLALEALQANVVDAHINTNKNRQHTVTKIIWHVGKNKNETSLFFDNIRLSLD